MFSKCVVILKMSDSCLQYSLEFNHGEIKASRTPHYYLKKYIYLNKQTCRFWSDNKMISLRKVFLFSQGLTVLELSIFPTTTLQPKLLVLSKKFNLQIHR